MPRRKKQLENDSGIFKNRIVLTGVKPAKDFKLNASNFRIHPEIQSSAMESLLLEIGWVTGVIENVMTGNLIDGHLRVTKALEKGPYTLVPYVQVSISDDEERKILAVFDKISTMARTDDEKLAKLINELHFEAKNLNDVIELMRSSSDINLDDFFVEKPIEQIISEKFALTLEFSSKEDYAETLSALNEINPNPSAAVRHLLSLL